MRPAMAHNYLEGLIGRERLSFQEQKKHYETSKYLLDQAEDEFQSWMSKERKIKHNDSWSPITSAYVPKQKASCVSESPSLSKDDGQSGNSSVSSNSDNRGLQTLDGIDDREIMRKISKQRMREDAMMRRLSSMGSEHDKLTKVAGNRRRASDCTSSCVSSTSSQMSRPAARDVGLKRSSMSAQEMSSSDVFGVW